MFVDVLMLSFSQPLFEVFDTIEEVASRVLVAYPICRNVAVIDTAINLAAMICTVAKLQFGNLATARSLALMITAVFSSRQAWLFAAFPVTSMFVTVNTKLGHLVAASYRASVSPAKGTKATPIDSDGHSITSRCTASVVSAEHSLLVKLVVSEVDTSLKRALVDGAGASARYCQLVAVFVRAAEFAIVCLFVSLPNFRGCQ